MNVKIRYEKRRTLVMRVTQEGVLVLIPRGVKRDHPAVQEFIRSGLDKLEQRIFLSDTSPRQTSPQHLRGMVRTWAGRIGVQPLDVRLRKMVRRWGTCSSSGHVTLNRYLCCVPPHLAEYVVCHELVHMREFNHGKGFKALMSQYMPDWKEREKALAAYLIVRKK